MDSSAFDEPSWDWPEDMSKREPQPAGSRPTTNPQPATDLPPKRRTYSPRTCRICLETVLPTFEPAPPGLPGVFTPSPSVSYISADPNAGRLLRPCQCRGSSRYVHEGCLQAWRHADPAYGQRNFWQCPTCGFKYRLERMRWARIISSPLAQIGLTLLVLFLAVFALGFVGDSIINLYHDPISTLTSPLTGDPLEPVIDEEYSSSWAFHFMKGLASVGLLSFAKVILAMSPWQWWNLRSSGILGNRGRPAATGRDRLQSTSSILILIGVGTFLWGSFQFIRSWSRKALEKTGERVMDVQGEDDFDDQDESSLKTD